MQYARHRESKTEFWNQPKGAKHEALWSWTKYVSDQLRRQRQDVRTFVSVAQNFAPTGNDEIDWAIRSAFKYKIRDNFARAGIDTAVSMVALARTAPQYLTTGSGWDLARKAEKRSRVLQSQFYELGVFDLMQRAFRGACEGGTGFIFGEVGPDGMPRLFRALHNEVLVDPEDGRYGFPRVVAVVRFEDRAELLKQYGSRPSLKTIIEDATGPTSHDYSDFFLRRDNKADRVRVVRLWRLPTVEGGDDGLYLKCVSSGTLEERPHTTRRHRGVKVVFAERDQGYYGQSLTERMLPAVMQVAEIDNYIAATQRLGSNAKWFIPAGAGLTADDITNAPVQTHELQGGAETAPILRVHAATPPDLVNQRNQIKQDAYDAEGFGDNSVTGDVNKGLASGEAVRRADDVKSRRFMNAARFMDGSYLGVCRLIEDLNDECTALNPDYTVKARNRSGRRTWIKTTRWKELQFDAGAEADVQMFPISAQATTAAGKWQQVRDWINDGFISRSWAMYLQEFPDIQAYDQLEGADLDLIREQIDNLIDVEEPREEMLLPVEFQDLESAKYWVNCAQKRALQDGAPDVVMSRFERYLAHVRYLEEKAASAAQAAAPAPAALNPNAAAAQAAAAQQQQLS